MADLASLYIKVDSKGVVTASKDLNKLTGDSKKAETATEGVTKSFSKLQAVVVALASSYALLKMAQYIKDTALLAARYTTLGVVMRVVGDNAGYSGAQMNEFARGLQKAGIAMVESRNTLARMIQAQIDLTNATKLARIAQNAAVIDNINSSEAFEHMIHGLQTGHPRILRTIGLNVDFNASVKALAVSLGIKKDALNEAQIMQGRVNAVMKAGVLIEGTYEAAMGTAGKKLTSFIRYVDDFKVKMGLAFGPATVTLVDAATEAMKDMQEQISRPEAQEALRELSSQLAKTIVKIGKDLPKAIETLIVAVDALASSFSVIVNIWTDPVWDKMDKFFGIASDWQEGMRSAANKMSPEFHKISESMDKFISQYEKMQEIFAKGVPIKLDFALEDPDKFFGEMKAELLAWEKEGFESIKKWYKSIEALAQEKMDSISELEDEETRVFEENLAHRLVVLKKYYENIETAAQEARDSDAEWEDQLLRSAKEIADYRKKLADESNDYIDKLAEAASYYEDLIGFEDTYHKKMLKLINAEAKARAKATGDDVAAARWAAQEKGRLEQKLFEDKTKYIDEGFGALASSFSDIASLYDKGSDAAKKWEEASKAMEIAQRAVAVVNAVAAIANQGLGDPYTAFARIAAMAAAMGALLASIGESVGGGSGASTVSTPPKSTVLGAEAGTGSESVQNIYELLQDNNAEECNALRDIYNEIQDLNQNITGLVTSIIKGVGGDGFGAIDTQAGEWLGMVEGLAKEFPRLFGALLFGIVGLFPDLLNKITFGISGWLTDIVGGWLGSIFGGGGWAKVTAAGIEFGKINLGAIMEGADVFARAFAKIHKHTEGGWFHSDKDEYWTEYKDLDEDVIRLLTNIFKNIGDSFVLLAEGLGVDAQAVYDYILPITQLDLKGMNAEEIDKAVMDFFSNITDTMAEDLFGDIIKKHQKVGEGLYETAIRLVMQKEIILEALKMTGLAFEGTAQEAVDFSQALIEIAGDFEVLMDAYTAYHDAFFTDAEKQIQLYEKLTEAFGDLGLDLPGTRQGLRALIEGLDLTTESGMEMYVALLKLAEASGIYYDTLEDNIKIIIDAQRALLGTTETGALEDIADKYGLDPSTEDGYQSLIDVFTKMTPEEVMALAESLGVGVGELVNDMIFLNEYLNKETAKAAAIAAQQRNLDIRLMELQGDATGALAARRAIELAAMDKSLHSLQKYIWALEDAEQLARTRTNLDIRLMELQGDATGALAARRAIELAAMDKSLHSLQKYIWALEDVAKATEKAQADLRAAFAAERERITNAYNAQINALNISLNNAKNILSEMQGNVNKLRSAKERMRLEDETFVRNEYQNAQRKLALVLSQAQQGDFSGIKDIDKTLNILTSSSADTYKTFTDYQRDYRKTYLTISKLETLTKKQLTHDEQMVLRIENQIELAKSYYDSTLDAMDSQLDTLLGIDQSIMSVADAIAALAKALLGKEEGAAIRPMIPDPSPPPNLPNLLLPGLEYTGPSNILNNNKSKTLVDNVILISEVKKLRAEIKASNFQNNKNTAKMARTLDKFDGDGLPAERTA